MLPVLIVFITAFMTAANYFITRHFTNEDVYGNKLKEKIAELRANQTIDFFNKSINNLDTLNDTFHSICKFDPSKSDDDQFNYTIIKIKALVDQQMTMDTSVVNSMKIYKEFVVNQEFDIQAKKILPENSVSIYNRSNILYINCIAKINDALNKLTQR